MRNKENQKYSQIRLSFNLNEKEDIYVYDQLVANRQKPSKKIILMLYEQLTLENQIMSKLDQISSQLNTMQVVTVDPGNSLIKESDLSLDFNNFDLDDLESILK